MTSGPDRSITGGISLPKWMKSKISDRAFDFEDNAFSPPTGDDGFFLIRYRKTEESPPVKVAGAKYTPVSSIIETKNTSVDLTKHTSSCKEFIPNAKITPREIGLRNVGQDDILKSTGVDDGFKGEGAACGYSVVAVAHQMLAERNGAREELAIPKSQRVRRNSKSLPSSPLSSPKLLRKNPYFTNIIFGSSDKVSSGGLAHTLIGSALSGSTEGSTDDLPRMLSKAASADSTPSSPPPLLRARPSQLREMNFWSPTSM